MNRIRSRLDRLERCANGPTKGRVVIVLHHEPAWPRPAVEWHGDTGLSLRVPEGSPDNPLESLAPAQLQLIGPRDFVTARVRTVPDCDLVTGVDYRYSPATGVFRPCDH